MLGGIGRWGGGRMMESNLGIGWSYAEILW